MLKDRFSLIHQFVYPNVAMLPIYPTPSQRAALDTLESRSLAHGAIALRYGLLGRRITVSVTLAPGRFAYFIVGVRGNVAEYRPNAPYRSPYIRPSRRKK